MGPKALKVRGNRAENQENGKKVVKKLLISWLMKLSNLDLI